MKLLKAILASAMLSVSATALAQDCDIDIAIADITKGNVVPEGVGSRLEGKLANALAKAGIVAAPYDAQFFIAGRFDDAYNDVISGPSQKSVVKTTLTLYIGDADNQKVFATESFELKGVGASDEQAYTRALNQVSPSNQKLISFIRKGKEKIIDYFDANYDTYINNARKAMAARDYDQALFYANSIPSCCRGYREAQNLAMKIYSENTDYIGNRLLAQAKAAWAADPTEAGAREAHKYLSQIDPAASCIGAANSLSSEIGKTTKKQWEFENIQKHNDAVALEKQRINAVKEVGVAWAKSRPRVVNRYVFLRRW